MGEGNLVNQADLGGDDAKAINIFIDHQLLAEEIMRNVL